MKLKEGWLLRQLEQASKTVASWTEVKRQTMRLKK